jgi:exodeoxyribonuclease VII large subunit
VIFSRNAKDIKFKLEDGLKVICGGRISAYGPRSQFQIIVESLEPKGIGGLQLALEQLKKRLEKEGLFSPAHKRPIPYLPSRIGVVTSLQGAAIKDILKVLERRFKEARIIINPVRVQGEGAREEIAQAIGDFNEFNRRCASSERIEVLIVGRGGGSIEDLWAFNEEIVARSIYDSTIPVISAVGHERDFTISDLVADVRAATPSVAAEIVIPKKEELQSRLLELREDLLRALEERSQMCRDGLQGLLHRLAVSGGHIVEMSAGAVNTAHKKLLLLNPCATIIRFKEKISDYANQIYVRMGHVLKVKQIEFSKSMEKLTNLSPLHILARGYSITFELPGGSILKDARGLKAGTHIKTKLHKGQILSEVKEVIYDGGNEI